MDEFDTSNQPCFLAVVLSGFGTRVTINLSIKLTQLPGWKAQAEQHTSPSVITCAPKGKFFFLPSILIYHIAPQHVTGTSGKPKPVIQQQNLPVGDVNGMQYCRFTKKANFFPLFVRSFRGKEETDLA
jgi:hypothetical protein